MGGSRAEWTGLGSVQEVGGEREGEEFVRMKRKRTPREWEHAAGTGSDWPVRASAREKGDKRVDGHSNNNRIIISKRLHTARSHSSTVCVSGLLRTCTKMFLPTADEWSSTESPGWLLEWTLVLWLCWQYWPLPFWRAEQSLWETTDCLGKQTDKHTQSCFITGQHDL